MSHLTQCHCRRLRRTRGPSLYVVGARAGDRSGRLVLVGSACEDSEFDCCRGPSSSESSVFAKRSGIIGQTSHEYIAFVRPRSREERRRRQHRAGGVVRARADRAGRAALRRPFACRARFGDAHRGQSAHSPSRTSRPGGDGGRVSRATDRAPTFLTGPRRSCRSP